MDYYVMQVARGWVQIRRSDKAPIAELSEAKQKIKLNKLEWSSEELDYINKLRNKNIRIKVCTFSGGKTVKTMTTSEFTKGTGIRVGYGEVIRLNKSVKEILELE